MVDETTTGGEERTAGEDEPTTGVDVTMGRDEVAAGGFRAGAELGFGAASDDAGSAAGDFTGGAAADVGTVDGRREERKREGGVLGRERGEQG